MLYQEPYIKKYTASIKEIVMICRKKQKCIQERADSCLVVYDPETDMTHIFNETATWLWENMPEDDFESSALVNELIKILNNAQDLDLNEVHSDCFDCIQTMHKQGLLVIVSDE